ncbi:hypothetical protein BGX21_001860 [Mortierella sp. AD011]|nr:hypothetical protein BGX20_004614 [Mortierella sp. AD010]KAF9401383.1 hypothetical protein BGX21_001857 [Mortierella sp. AD011]KAF9401386.1 hypothetical protein BGX21_001860 [Mortierella sp. AD011]
MFEPADYVQTFDYNGIIRKLEVFRPGPGAAYSDSKDFVLLEDLKDHFDLVAVHFEREDGVALAFTRDSNLRRHVPERIPACKGSTIYIVPNNNVASESPLTALTALTADSQQQQQQQQQSKAELPPSEQNLCKPRAPQLGKGYHSIVINIQEPQNPHGSIPLSHAHNAQDPTAFIKGGSTSHATQKRAIGIKGYQTELDQQERKLLGDIRQETEGAVIDVLERCKESLIRLALILAKAEEILSTSYSFEQGNGPRLFLILPDLRRKWDATNILSNHFRLFFLCECGLHTVASEENNGRPAQLHLADHEGYIIRQPAEFVRKYGPYLLVMLEMLKFGNQISGYVLPGLSASGSLFPPKTLPTTSLNLDRVNKSIAFLEELIGLDTSRPWELTEYLRDVAASDGIDLDGKMASYLDIDENKRLYANMYRMGTPDRADWVCRQHHPSKFEHAIYYELESSLSSVGARLDHGGKIVATLTSELHAEQLRRVILTVAGLGFHHLEVKMGWRYSLDDLAKLEELVGQSDIESVTLAMPPSPAPSPAPSPGPPMKSPSMKLPFPATVAAPSYPSPTPESSFSRESEDGFPDSMSTFGRGSSTRSSSVSSGSRSGGRSDSVSSGSRSGGRSDSVSSGQGSPASMNTKLPDWAYTYYDQLKANKPYEDGRTRHCVESAPYMLPNDLAESDRLDAQHYIVRYMFKGNYNVRLDRNSNIKILDVATGTGVWALEMALEFPKASVYGIDLSPIFPTPETSSRAVPPNCYFQLCNVLDGLPFPDNYFDFVYQRLLVYALTPAQRKQVNTELLRVLKPSGHIQLVESDGLVYNAGQMTTVVNDLSLETAMKKNVDPKEVQRLKSGLRRTGFANINSFHVALPVGDWGGPLGQLSMQNMHGLATIWLKGELGRQTEEECEATLAEVDKECEQFQSFYKVWLVVGQKPQPSTMSPPPSNKAKPRSP